MADSRKYDYKKDTDNGKRLSEFDYTVDEVLQAGWYALMSRNEQNDKHKLVMELAKTDPRFKGILENAKAQLKAGKKRA